MQFPVLAPRGEAPDRFHPRFVETMRWYRYMELSYPNQVKRWKRQKHFSMSERLRRLVLGPGRPAEPRSVDLAGTGGHRVHFPGATLSPDDFILKHYLVLSLDHAVRKYVGKTYAETEVAGGASTAGRRGPRRSTCACPRRRSCAPSRATRTSTLPTRSPAR